MATTGMLTGNALTVKRWSMQGFVDMYKNTAYGRMMSRGTIWNAKELSRANKGDAVTLNFTGILTGEGLGEGGTLEGNEEALDLNSDTMVMNVVRHAIANPNAETIEQQRTLVDFENRSRKLLPRWHGSRLDASMFNQLAGVDSTTITVDTTVYSGTKKTFVQGLNAITAPSSNRVIRPGGAANDESLTSTDTFTLDLIDAALERVLTSQPTIEPLSNNEYDLYVHPTQLVDLKRDTTGKIQWLTNELAQVQGGDTSVNGLKNMDIFTVKPVAKYANVNILVSPRVATGVSSADSSAVTSVKRAVLVGANAIAFGSSLGGRLTDTEVPFQFFTQLKDYDYEKGIEARMIYGAKKLVFSGEDYGVVTLPTYGALHS